MTALADFAFPSEDITRCPFPFYAALRSESPVFRDPAGGGYFVSRRKDILQVLQHPEIFSNQGYRGDPRLGDDPRVILGIEEPDLPGCPITTPFNMSMSDPPEHTVKRRAAAGLVSRERLERAEEDVRAIAHGLIDAFIDRGSVEFRSEFAAPMALLTICQLAGFPREDGDIFRSWVLGSTHARLFMDESGLSTLQHDTVEQLDYCRRLILERHANPCGDFLSEYIAAAVERDGGLNLPYLVSEVRLMLLGGNETTQRLMTSTMLLLVRHPAVLERIRADRSLVPVTLEEALRVESPTQWVSRLCVVDTELGGVPIPAGSFVLMLFGSANRDETWEEPDAFDIDRPDVQKYQMAFGGGAHRCIGAPIARFEARIALNAILDRLDAIRLAPHEPHEIENIDSLQKRVPKTLPLLFRRA